MKLYSKKLWNKKFLKPSLFSKKLFYSTNDSISIDVVNKKLEFDYI